MSSTRCAALGVACVLLLGDTIDAGLAARSDVAAKPVSFAILEDYDKNADLADIDKDFALFKELEITTWRGSFGWDDYEPANGKFDLAWLHSFVERAAAHRIRLRPYLGYTPQWAARRGGADSDVWNNPPANIERWSRFAATVARELRKYPNIASYEIYNEENVKQWWDGDAAEYARVLAHGARAVRGADPDARLLFGGLVFPDAEWVQAVCGSPGVRGAFDILPFHAYPETWTPADVTAENYLGGLDAFLRVADGSCGRRPIWINETGFATVPGKSEREQASWWVRAVATFLAHPRVEHIGVYEIKDLPTDQPVIGDAPNYNLGLTRIDRTKKLAFHTVDLLTDLLDTGTLRVADEELTVINDGERGDPYQHIFVRPDGDRVLIAWNRSGARNITLTWQTKGRSAVEYLLDGQSKTVAQFDGKALRRLDLEPSVPRIFRIGANAEKAPLP
jgi:hypothetical protein